MIFKMGVRGSRMAGERWNKGQGRRGTVEKQNKEENPSPGSSENIFSPKEYGGAFWLDAQNFHAAGPKL